MATRTQFLESIMAACATLQATRPGDQVPMVEYADLELLQRIDSDLHDEIDSIGRDA